MGRPPNPVTIQGPAYVWAQGSGDLRLAEQQYLVEDAAQALAAGRVVATAGARVLPLLGVMLGQSTGEEIVIPNLDLQGIGYPLFGMFGVAAEGRVPGVPCEIGLFSESARNRQWLVSFGIESAEFWRNALNLRAFLRMGTGALVFTPRNNSDRVRRELWDARRAADKTWRS